MKKMTYETIQNYLNVYNMQKLTSYVNYQVCFDGGGI